jgi:hypothetical protein
VKFARKHELASLAGYLLLAISGSFAVGDRFRSDSRHIDSAKTSMGFALRRATPDLLS